METRSPISPENAAGPFSFKIGEEGFGFDGGFTEGEFTGMIRGADGKEFAGLVENLGGGRYKVEDWEGGRIIESPAEALAAAAVETSVGGLEDAAAEVAMEAAPAAVAGPTPEQVAEDIERTRMGMAAPPDEEVRAAAEEPAAEEAFQPPAPALGPQEVSMPEPSQAPLPEPAPQPEIVAAPAEVGRPATATEARQEFDKEFKDVDARFRQAKYEAERKDGLEKQVQQLRAEAEKARKSVDRLRNKDRIAKAISEEGRLVTEAKKLEGQAAAINALGQDQIRAIEDRRQRVLGLIQEVGRWENLMRNPALIEEYRGLDGGMQEDLTAVDRLFGSGNPGDQAVLDPARKRIESRMQARRAEIEAMFPRRFMELAGMAPRQDLGDAAVDYTLDRDLIERYYQFADQFYAELMGQPQAVQPEMPVAPEPIAPPEPVIEPVIEPTAEPTVEATEAVPTETLGPGVAAYPEEVTVPPTPIEEAAPEPVEASVEAPMPGGVAVDGTERARAGAAVPVQAPVEAPPPEEAVEAPAPAEAAAETLGQIQERAERRRNNFADAVAQLEEAYIDNSGTQAERVGRVVERVRGIILAGLELAEEGGAAQEVVMTVLGKLNNEQNRRLVQAAVGQAPEQVEQAVGNTLRARGAFGPDGKPKSRKELEDAGLVGLIELLLQLGMSFTDASINAVITEVQSATGAGR